MKNNKNVISLFILALTFTKLVSAQSIPMETKDDSIRIINTPQCAADMSRPADSVFIAASLRNTGIILNNVAKSTKRNQTEFIGQGLKFYKTKLIYLTNIILDGMNAGTLPFVATKAEAEKNLKSVAINVVTKKFYQQSECLQVNEINTKYANLFIRGVNQDTLTELAKQYTTETTQADCKPENIKSDLDLYPVYNFEFKKIQNMKAWNQIGFQFWASFKIYLSTAWRSFDVSAIEDSSLNSLTMMVPMEEEIMILSNGCKSIERPECSSQFLSSAELKNLFTTDREKIEMTSSSVEMKDLLTDNTDGTDAKIKTKMAEKSGDKQWISDFQKSYMSFAAKNIENLFIANKLYSSAVTQKTTEGLSVDLENELQNPANQEEAFYMCAEHRLLTQEQPLNIMKIDMENLNRNNSVFDQYLNYGMTVTDIINTHKKLSVKLTALCDKYDKNLANENENLWTGYKSWYKSFLSRYQIINAQINLEREALINNPPKFEIPKPLDYVKNICSSSIDCHRRMTESIVQINKLLIHSRTFFRTQIQSSPIFNERAEKVACGIYDPFEVSRLNKKKLLTDIGTSLLFGWTNLPIYLDIDYKPKGLVSFKKLVDDKKINFEMGFKAEAQTTLSLSLGSFINVPCSISISKVGTDVSNQNAGLIYSGLSVHACKGTKNQTIDNTNSSVDEFKKSSNQNVQGCVECALNFKQISTLNFLNVFSPVRSLIRLVEGIVRYRNIRNNDVINPRVFSINKDYLVDTYKKYGQIPAACVPLLSKGLKCSPSACEALAKNEFEMKTGIEVQNVDLISDKNHIDKFKKAIFTSSKCKDPIEVNMKCSSNGKRFRLSVSNNDIKNCDKE